MELRWLQVITTAGVHDFSLYPLAKMTQLQSLVSGFLTFLFAIDWLILSFLIQIPKRLTKLAYLIVITLTELFIICYGVDWWPDGLYVRCWPLSNQVKGCEISYEIQNILLARGWSGLHFFSVGTVCEADSPRKIGMDHNCPELGRYLNHNWFGSHL